MTGQDQKECREALLPCPFCGRAAGKLVDATKVLGVWRLVHRCKVLPTITIEKSTPGAVAAEWNTRATSAEPDTMEACESCGETHNIKVLTRNDDGHGFCPECVATWNPPAQPDKAEVPFHVEVDLALRVSTILSGPHHEQLDKILRLFQPFVERAALPTHRDDNGLVEKLDRLGTSSTTGRKRRWVPLDEVLALVRAAQAKACA